MTRYYISIDFDQAGFEAENEEEALRLANEAIKDGFYSLDIVDREPVETERA